MAVVVGHPGALAVRHHHRQRVVVVRAVDFLEVDRAEGHGQLLAVGWAPPCITNRSIPTPGGSRPPGWAMGIAAESFQTRRLGGWFRSVALQANREALPCPRRRSTRTPFPMPGSRHRHSSHSSSGRVARVLAQHRRERPLRRLPVAGRRGRQQHRPPGRRRPALQRRLARAQPGQRRHVLHPLPLRWRRRPRDQAHVRRVLDRRRPRGQLAPMQRDDHRRRALLAGQPRRQHRLDHHPLGVRRHRHRHRHLHDGRDGGRAVHAGSTSPTPSARSSSRSTTARRSTSRPRSPPTARSGTTTVRRAPPTAS